MSAPNHALILGASGISGWALLDQCRNYPTPTTFSKITGTTNRPLSLSDALIPADPRINLVNGIDFTKSVPEVKDLLKQKIPDIDGVTHVFFTAYIAKPTFAELKDINNTLLRTAIEAISALAPNLLSVILQTGGKHYGVEFTDKITLHPPLVEETPRIPDPYAQNIFYYSQYDILSELSRKSTQQWTFTEVRPDVIIGFVPGDNAMDCARGLAIYLTLWQKVHGAGSVVHFPGTAKSWTSKHTDSSQDTIARFEIFAALNRERCGKGESFNIADGEVVSWSDKWPGLCAYYGLKGEGPREGTMAPSEFIEENRGLWDNIVRGEGLKMNAAEKYQAPFLDFVMKVFDFDRQYSLEKIRRVGFEYKRDTVEGFAGAWDMLKKAGIIPKA